MRYLALVTDYDGSIASHDRASEETIRALRRLKNSGRRAVLITGRRLDDLRAVFQGERVFDLIVAENGGVLYNPETQERTQLANTPSKLLVQSLQARGVAPRGVAAGH